MNTFSIAANFGVISCCHTLSYFCNMLAMSTHVQSFKSKLNEQKHKRQIIIPCVLYSLMQIIYYGTYKLVIRCQFGAAFHFVTREHPKDSTIFLRIKSHVSNGFIQRKYIICTIIIFPIHFMKFAQSISKITITTSCRRLKNFEKNRSSQSVFT